MTHYRLLRRAALAGALALPILTTGCGLFSQEASNSIDPPQNTAQTGSQNAAQNGAVSTGGTPDGSTPADAGQAAEQGDQAQVTVYLKDANGLLAPVTVQAALGDQKKAGQQALEMMVDGGTFASKLPAGFQGVLPKGTQVMSFDVVADQKMAAVNFSKEFGDYNAAEERKIVEAVTWTLTGMEGIQKVQISMEGQKMDEMPVAGLPIDLPLTRAMGINLEQADGVDITRSTPVTLYFTSVTPNNETYYVPVTRLVDRSDNRAKSAVQQLISGPLNERHLTAVITPDVTVKNVTKKNDVVTVDLHDDSYQPGMQEPAEMMKAIVLSLIENTGASKVQIMLNGKSDFTDTNNQSYSQPVTRPDDVNAFKS
jgi:germination protein M